MSDAGTALSYLAELAPGAGQKIGEVASRRGDLVMLGWLDPRRVFGLTPGDRPPVVPGTTELQSLAVLDRLHADEYLLRVGWLFVAGTVDGDRFLFPIVSARASLSGTRRGYAVTGRTDPAVTPGLVAPAVAEVLDDALASLFTLAGSEPPSGALAAGYPAARSWLSEYFAAAGLPRPPLVDPELDPWPRRRGEGLVLVPAVGVYLARAVDAPTMAADLSAWSKVDVAGSALAAIYEVGDAGESPADAGPDEEAVEESEVDSAFPLNAAQAAVIRRARREPVVVVAGPPGTGKSHLAAALAVDEVARGHSVLLAAQSEQAVAVIAEFLGRYPGPRWVRFGDRAHRMRVADDLAGGMAAPYSRADMDRIEERLVEARGRRDRARRRILSRLSAELAFARGLEDRERLAGAAWAVPSAVAPGFDADRAIRMLADARDAGGPFGSWFRARAERRLRRRLGVDPAAALDDVERAIELGRAEAAVRRALAGGGVHLAAEWRELERAEEAWREEFGRAVEARRRSRHHRRSVSTRAVATLASALRAGRAKRRRALRELRSERFLDVLPLWLGTLSEIDDTLPKEAAVFDVVVFDEGSQIDQLHAAPALARARRAVVIGDPRQLRHVSFVGDAAMEAAAEARGIDGVLARLLDVRRNSLFDVAAATAPVTTLEEHFRSVPHLIEFSDRRFYDGRLRLMTQHPSTERLDAIRVLRVHGERDGDGVNAVEVAAAVEEAARLVDGEETTIGVLSPFRAQADALEAALVERFHPDVLARADVRVGTVHGFQGSERDVVIVSLAVDAAGGSLRFIEDPHLFNVMVTRARRGMIVITSLPEGAEGEGLLAAYFRWAAEPPLPSRSNRPPEGWMAELARQLAGFDLPVVARYPVAGYEVDLTVGDGAAALGLECEVFEGDPVRHVTRHLDLVRAGWRLEDVFRSRWLATPETAAQRIVEEVLSGGGVVRSNRPGREASTG